MAGEVVHEPNPEQLRQALEEFVNMAAFHFNTVHANDFSFYEVVNAIVQEEPTTALGPERAGQLAGTGVVHGQPFNPDDSCRATLDHATRTGAAISPTLAFSPRDPEATRSLLQTDDPYPSVMSLSGSVAADEGGAYTIGPQPTAGHWSNWIQTVPGKSRFTILRLYGPLQAWFDQTGRPGDIQPT